jgi:exodeoxyribonuclease VII large subunit
MANSTDHIYTPSELNREVRLHIEMGFPRISLEAEISNLSRPASGHLYFSLKDDKAQIRCAMFRSSASRLTLNPANGMNVVARGRISLYEARGDFQLIVDSLKDAGEGLLRRQFDELKKKLESEGLFDQGHKRKIPDHPNRIGVVTSPSGAAIRDILHILRRRWPLAHVRVYPASVQGLEAPLEITRAIAAANAQKWADTLIIGRGGGSLEDLAAFNDEVVARAVFSSGIPVISAVGHETDFSICDFVADLRAPTPSAAAELATPDQASLKESFARAERLLARRMQSRLERDAQGLDHLSRRLHLRHPASLLTQQAAQLEKLQSGLSRHAKNYFADQRDCLDKLEQRLNVQHPGRHLAEFSRRIENARQAMQRLTVARLSQQRQHLKDLVRTLNAVSPLETIARGYAVVTSPETGTVISSIRDVKAGQSIRTQLSDGSISSRVNSCEEDSLIPEPD